MFEQILQNEPLFREEQVEKAVFQDLIDDWQNAFNLPKSLRERLNKEFPLKIEADFSVSHDKKTNKAVFSLPDGLKTEAVLMKGKRNTLCLSCQVGCLMNCKFCLTGKTGFKRNLTLREILNQALFFGRLLKKENQKINNVVFMGMGEPLLNYENVFSAVRILNKKTCFGISSRKISISTIGLPALIKKMAREDIRPNLAVSLHSAAQKTRQEIMPFVKDHTLEELSLSIEYYINRTGRRVMFEYLLLEGINDSDQDALLAVKFIKQFKEPKGFSGAKNFYFVNLIAFNSFKSCQDLSLKASSKKRFAAFKKIFAENGINCSQRYKFGQNIKAACGQLAGN